MVTPSGYGPSWGARHATRRAGASLDDPTAPLGRQPDCRDLTAGSTLLLPIPVDSALFSVGDGHAAQGDGEVGGTAIECPMDEVTLTFDVRDDFPLTGPVARTADAWLTLGVGASSTTPRSWPWTRC
ncbi:acetamidase/formamidase family protein [Micromonospora sp. M12]